EIWNEVIALLTVSAAHLFKQGLHKATAPFCVGFQRLYEFCSFPITAFQFTTNEPQSYVLGGRNHPLHIKSGLGNLNPLNFLTFLESKFTVSPLYFCNIPSSFSIKLLDRSSEICGSIWRYHAAPNAALCHIRVSPFTS